MKVALCLSGQTRTLEKSAEFLLPKIVNRFNPDIFVSTWEDQEPNQNQAYRYHDLFGDKIKMYESHWWKNNSPTIFDSGPNNNANPMFYKIWRADLLRQEYMQSKGFVYDLVIRSRTDLRFDGEIEQEKIDIALKGNNTVCGDSDCPGRDWLCDCFAFGDSKGMASYSSTWWILKDLRDSGIKINELMLLESLRRKGVTLIVSDFSKFGYTIIR